MYGRPKEVDVNAVVALENRLPSMDAMRLSALERLADGLGPAELYWIAAWSAARAERLQRGDLPAASAAKAPAEQLTILYGSQTGQAKRVASQLHARAEAAGLAVRLVRADAYPQRDLAKETHLVVVISTQGDAEPPDDARGLVEFVLGKRAPKLPGLRYAVLGLGDTSYPQFCAIGRQLDERLAELGATRFAALGEADVDVDAVAAPWSDSALEQAKQVLGATQPARVATLQSVPHRATHTRERPFLAPVLENQSIVARDAGRDVRHVELSLEGSGLNYEPGDSLGVWPRNPSALVDQWLNVLKLDGEQAVTHDGRSLPLRQWLSAERELTRLSRPLVAVLADASGDEDLAGLLRPDRSASLATLMADHQPIDLWRRYASTWSAEELVAALRPLTPRLYSIASSQKAVGEEVHLTVGVVDYVAHGERHWGAASSFLAHAGDEQPLPIYIEPNERFRLPQDDARDIIMIGPGTGVAPFRAFVQERRETAARGRNWLFFGNRHFTSEFLYQVEWQTALRDGSLHRLDLAFSRDDAAKVYVQHRLREQGRELYAWLQEGAHLYVCGDANHMAKDVHAALIDVAVAHGGHAPEQAREWLSGLLQQGRYARDVY